MITYLVFCIIAFFTLWLIWTINNLWQMRLDHRLCLWPAIARCHICRKKIYFWQRTIFRHYEFLHSEVPGHGAYVAGSARVHRSHS